jgi:hypothetical protein
MADCTRSLFLSWIVIAVFIVTGCGREQNSIRINVHDIENYSGYQWIDSTIFPFTGNNTSISSRSYKLKKGKYSMHLKEYGTPGQNRAPTLDIQIGPYPPLRITIDLQQTMQDVNFELPEDMEGKFVFTFTDDYYSQAEDRNAYIIFPIEIGPF